MLSKFRISFFKTSLRFLGFQHFVRRCRALVSHLGFSLFMREVVGATLGSFGVVSGAEYLVVVQVIGAMVGSLHVVLDGCTFGCCFGCCTGGAWCHHSNCFGHSLTPSTQTCAKGKWLGKKSTDKV